MSLELGRSSVAVALPGLTSAQAGERLRQYGPNEVAEEREHPGLAFLRKFWAPVPWMLEAVIALQLFLGKVTERRPAKSRRPDRILAWTSPPSKCARQGP